MTRRFSRSLLTAAAGLAFCAPAAAFSEGADADERLVIVRPGEKKPRKARRAGAGQAAAAKAGAQTRGGALARDLSRAMSVDPTAMGHVADRGAALAGQARVDSITPGSPYIAGSARGLGGGSSRNIVEYEPNTMRSREAELEAGMPLWLPGQRDALQSTVLRQADELAARYALRRLELAGQIRQAWWSAQRAMRETGVARERVASARDIQHDMDRRVALGESASAEALQARNETLAAETELAQAAAAAQAARAAYETLTLGGRPDGVLEGAARRGGEGESHPALAAPRASVERAEAELRLIDATPIDNPEVGIFGRKEYSAEGFSRTESTTMGVRFRVALPTQGRNAPRRALAQAALTRATLELAAARRLVAAEAVAARKALEAAGKADALAGERLKVADEQFEMSRKAFRLGEAGAADMFRSRQLQLEAQKIKTATSIAIGVARSRVNQALGYAPGD